jgi:hypothetical protein
VAVRTELSPNLDSNFISKLLVLAANLVPENTPSTVSHLLRAASLLGYPVMGRAIGLFTRGIPAEIELAAGSRPGAVSGQLSYFGMGIPEHAIRALNESARLYSLVGDVYRQNIATLLSAALTKAAIMGQVPIEARARTVLDLLRQVPPHIRR